MLLRSLQPIHPLFNTLCIRMALKMSQRLQSLQGTAKA